MLSLLRSIGLWALTAMLIAQASVVAAGTRRICAKSERFERIRGECPEDYLGIDVLWEAIEPVVPAAFARYFPLQEDSLPPAVQIRYRVDPMRKSWRGEFMIVVNTQRNALSATFWQAKEPLQVQLHHLVHEQLYSRIAAAFANSTLTADSKEWQAVVRGMVPPAEQLINEIQIERFATTAADCPALAAQVSKLKTLNVRPPVNQLFPGFDPRDIPMHPQTYDVVIFDAMRLTHVRSLDGVDPFFAWAEETVKELQPCWKPAEP